MSSSHAAAPSHGHGHDHPAGEHISSMGTYLTIFGLLLILTVLTFAVSYAELPGNWSIIAAIGVATVKAVLVAGWFMHLKYDTRFNVLVFLSAFWFMLVFFGFTLTDLTSRGALFQKLDNHTLHAEKGAKYGAPAVLKEGGHGSEGGHGGGH
ncbi:cytochrome C oxidase subunit IV family protein [Myxococcota bacterium]|nr:cytochrome C oxidase subunit IV family protein [Myxococcota bacterium]